MGYLLDSHILVWARLCPEKLSRETTRILENTAENVYYSIATPWELAIKEATGKLPLPADFFSALPALGFDCIPIEDTHIEALRSLPRLHGDPFDRMLVAQAKAEKLTLITADKRLAAYPVKTVLAGAKK